MRSYHYLHNVACPFPAAIFAEALDFCILHYRDTVNAVQNELLNRKLFWLTKSLEHMAHYAKRLEELRLLS